MIEQLLRLPQMLERCTTNVPSPGAVGGRFAPFLRIGKKPLPLRVIAQRHVPLPSRLFPGSPRYSCGRKVQSRLDGVGTMEGDMSSFQWIRADEVRAGDVVFTPAGGSSRAHFDNPEDAERFGVPRRVLRVDAPGSWTCDGHIVTWPRQASVLVRRG